MMNLQAKYRSLRQHSPAFNAHKHTWHIADYANAAYLLNHRQKRLQLPDMPPHTGAEAAFQRQLKQIAPQKNANFIEDIALPFVIQLAESTFERDFIVTILGTTLFTLLNAPKQMALLRINPHDMPKAIYEVLRYDPPIHTMIYMARTWHTVNALQIEPGQWIHVNLAAANHDPMIFSDANVFKVNRRYKHPALISHPGLIARWPLHDLMTQLLRTLPALRFQDAPQKRSATSLLRFTSLMIAW